MNNCLTKLMVAGAMISGIWAEDATSFVDAFKNGKVKGTIGTYVEGTDYEDEYASGGSVKSKESFSWQTAYLQLKYETARWNKLKLGVKFLAHGELFNDTDDSFSNGDDAFDKDIETKYSLPELYLDYAFTDKTNLRIGRWGHSKFTHIDDAQSEGFFLQTKEIENLDVVLGLMTRFAELDYDDGEDFGQEDDKQDLSDDAAYGKDSDDFLVFAEVTWKPTDCIELNPYVYHQGDYATVVGLDTKLQTKVSDSVKVGANVMGYGVSSDVQDTDDAFCWTIEPFAEVGGFTFAIGHTEFDGDEDDKALNKPAWFRDYLVGFDQDKEYAEQNCSVNYAKIKYKKGKFGTHLYCGVYDYGVDQDKQAIETELQFKYTFASNWDANVRFFDVNYNGEAESSDYQKVEARVRYNF